MAAPAPAPNLAEKLTHASMAMVAKLHELQILATMDNQLLPVRRAAVEATFAAALRAARSVQFLVDSVLDSPVPAALEQDRLVHPSSYSAQILLHLGRDVPPSAFVDSFFSDMDSVEDAVQRFRTEGYINRVKVLPAAEEAVKDPVIYIIMSCTVRCFSAVMPTHATTTSKVDHFSDALTVVDWYVGRVGGQAPRDMVARAKDHAYSARSHLAAVRAAHINGELPPAPISDIYPAFGDDRVVVMCKALTLTSAVALGGSRVYAEYLLSKLPAEGITQTAEFTALCEVCCVVQQPSIVSLWPTELCAARHLRGGPCSALWVPRPCRRGAESKLAICSDGPVDILFLGGHHRRPGASHCPVGCGHKA